MKRKSKNKVNWVNGLKNLGYTEIEIKEVMEKWICAGSRYRDDDSESRRKINSRTRYANLLINQHKFIPPPHSDFCVCGVAIKEQCFIMSDDYLENRNPREVLVSGNCCINTFVEKKGKRCSKCGEGHKNRLDNYCKKCRAENLKDKVEEENYNDYYENYNYGDEKYEYDRGYIGYEEPPLYNRKPNEFIKGSLSVDYIDK